jgi:23S rRNA (uridine2552-2'-O)-methyltransferase
VRLQDARRDHFRKLAKKEGYRSRASYKLIQLDNKYKLLKKGSVVIDFGAAPGGWMQVCSQKIGSNGLVLGIDIKEILPIRENAISLVENVFHPDIQIHILNIINRPADVILSDLAPNISGVWQIDHLMQIKMVQRVVEVMPKLLRLGGHSILKVFEGEETNTLIKRIKKIFVLVNISKPQASRSKSSELYLVCKSFRS